MEQTQTRQQKNRLLVLLCLPVLLSGFISTFLIMQLMSDQLEKQLAQSGQAITDHLALSAADQLVNEDILSLNVLAREAVDNNHFDFVAIYGIDNRVLAQAGKRQNSPNGSQQIDDNRSFNQQVTFQNQVAGHVEVGFDDSLLRQQMFDLVLVSVLLHALLLAGIVFLTRSFGDLFYLWIMSPENTNTLSDDQSLEAPSEALVEAETRLPETSILVVKLRPARLLPRYLSMLKQALLLHSGETHQLGDDLTVHFNSHDQMLQAVRAGILLVELIALLPDNISIKLAIHQADSDEELAKALKQCSYLASNSTNQLLTSRLVKERYSDSDQFQLAPYHSAMTPDGAVYSLESLKNHQLIQRQATELIKTL